jgi:hypothetical protein
MVMQARRRRNKFDELAIAVEMKMCLCVRLCCEIEEYERKRDGKG